MWLGAFVVDDVKNAWAIKLADGSRTLLAPNASVTVSADTAFVLHDTSGSVPGGLGAWHGDGPFVALTASTFVSGSPSHREPPIADGNGHVVYWSGTSSLADLVVDNVERPAPHSVLRGVNPQASTVLVAFFAGRLVVDHAAVISSYDPDSGVGVDLIAPAGAFSLATHIGVGAMSVDASGTAWLAPVDGSMPARMIKSGLRDADFTPDGSAILAFTTARALERIDVASGAATTLVGSNVAGPLYQSADGQHAAYATVYDIGSGLEDFWLTSATSATASTQLVAAATRLQMPSAFTDDSGFVFYVSDWGYMPLGGSLQVYSTSGAGPARQIAASVQSVQPAGKARLAFGATQPDATMNLAVVDLAARTAPTPIATKVLRSYYVSSDAKTLYYVSSDGLHLLALE